MGLLYNNAFLPTMGIVYKSADAVCVSVTSLTRRGLQLLPFLFPPLPGFEDAPQAGELAAAAHGRSAHPRHHAAGV